jgi:hypothetical protein
MNEGLQFYWWLQQEQYELPEDDTQCAIETYRGILSVLVF